MEKPFKKRVSRCSKVEASFSTENFRVILISRTSIPIPPNFSSSPLNRRITNWDLSSRVNHSNGFKQLQIVCKSCSPLIPSYCRLCSTERNLRKCEKANSFRPSSLSMTAAVTGDSISIIHTLTCMAILWKESFLRKASPDSVAGWNVPHTSWASDVTSSHPVHHFDPRTKLQIII